jgi:hypothetical protein
VVWARIAFRDEQLCFLSYDDAHHRLALINIPGLPVRDPDAVGTDLWPAPTTTSVKLATYRRLKVATPTELDGYVHSRAFAENPVGVNYVPEELCSRYAASEAMPDLLSILPTPEGKTPWDMLAEHSSVALWGGFWLDRRSR